jgi:hypothetical protein
VYVFHDGELSSDVTIADNQIYQYGNANGIHTETVSNLIVTGNRVYRVNAATGYSAIYARATVADTGNIMIHDNMALNGGGQWSVGVRFLPNAFGFGLVSIQGNVLPGANNKVALDAGTYNPPAYVEDNVP